MKFTMKLLMNKSLMTLAVALLAGVSMLAMTNSAQAVQIPYEDIGGTSITTPVFNTYTNVPNGVGNEADFVRIRPSDGGVTNNGTAGARNALYVNGLNSACNVGDKFDIRTYVHNGADDKLNDNGNGTSVAHKTNVRLVAPLNTEGNILTFTSTVSATDVSPVTDTARLFCEDGKSVKLKLVPSSVKVYSSQYGYNDVNDSTVNGSPLAIGSRVPGSGDVWGCWADRVNVAYTVEIVEEPVEAPDPVYTCDLLSVAVINNRKFKFTTNATARNGAVITDYTYNFGDSNKATVNDSNMVEHTYATSGNYKVTTTVGFNVTIDGVITRKTATSGNCEADIKVDIDAPIYACEMFTLTLSGRKATVMFLPVAKNGATFKDATITFKADGSTKQEVTTNNQNAEGKVVAMYTYDDKAKSLVATATVRFNVGDEVKEVTCRDNAVLAAETTTPTVIPNTGAGSFAGLLAAVTVAGAVAHRTFVLKRN
jgi:hypothetical protein